MGYRICYLAAAISGEHLAQAFGFPALASGDDQPQEDLWVAEMAAGGWSVLWSEDEAFDEKHVAQIAALSQLHDVVVCTVNETVMWASAEYWAKGARIWRLLHRGDTDDRYDLQAEGRLPDAFAAIKARCFAEQGAMENAGQSVDVVFEIPLDLAATYTGFRHDVASDDGAVARYLTLAVKGTKGPKRASWLRRLLGGAGHGD